MRFRYPTIVVLTLTLALSAWAHDDHKKKETQADLQKEAKVTMDQAKKTALDKEHGKIKSSELERENGKLMYSFDIQMKDAIHEVNVDAISGAILEDHVETAKDEAMEKKADAKQRKQPKK